MSRIHYPPLHIGAAEADITPSLPDWIIGVGKAFTIDDGPSFKWTARDAPAEEVHDPLSLQVIYLEQAGTRAVLLTADLLYPIGADRVVQAVAHAADVPPDAVFYAAAHNHNGPVESDAYTELLVERATRCAADAKARACPAVIDHAHDNYNRLIYDRSEPWGPVDGRIEAVRFNNADTGRPIALLLNYGCHPCSLDYDWNAVTADYPGAVRRHARRRIGADVPIAFLTGCAANVQMVGIRRFDAPRMYINTPKSDYETVDRLGRIIAERALRALDDEPRPLAADSIAVWREPIEIPVVFEATESEIRRRRADAETLAKAAAGPAIRPWEQTLQRVFCEMLDQSLQLVRRPDPRRPVHTGFLLLGDLAIVATPLELTWQMGARMRRGSSFPVTIIATTVFGYDGYLTESECYAQPRDDWSYEANGLSGVTGWTYRPDAPAAYLDAVTQRLAAVPSAAPANAQQHRSDLR